jgi:epoxyqueuosine reductase
MDNLDTFIQTAIVPFTCFEELKQDIATFACREDLNGFQAWIAKERYTLSPELGFEPQTLIVAAVPFRLYQAVFHHAGKRYASVIDKVYSEQEVMTILSHSNSYHLYYDYWLPQKRLAVRSGLADYGKNNLCYVQGMGSMLTLFCFISDRPCPETYTWREVQTLPACDGCGLCRLNCPTNAILENRFLLDNQKCLSNLNESGTDPFPDSIPKTAHHRTTNCSRCQEICPENKGRFDAIDKTVVFSPQETALLLSGEKKENLPPELAEKVTDCDMDWYYTSLPRNLTALFTSGNEAR